MREKQERKKIEREMERMRKASSELYIIVRYVDIDTHTHNTHTQIQTY